MLTKITIIFNDGIRLSQIFLNFCDAQMYIRQIEIKCKETGTPLPDILYDEWETI